MIKSLRFRTRLKSKNTFETPTDISHWRIILDQPWREREKYCLQEIRKMVRRGHTAKLTRDMATICNYRNTQVAAQQFNNLFRIFNIPYRFTIAYPGGGDPERSSYKLFVFESKLIYPK